MIFNPVIPIPIMILICVVMIALKRRGVVSYIRQIIIVILVFCINLRISVPADTVTIMQSDIDILFVVDNTISMLAEDYNGDDRRIDAVKEDVAYIIDEFPGARYALITVTDRADYLIPYTNESNLVIQAVDALEGQTKTYASGTTINVAYDVMKDNLENNKKSMEEDDNDRIQLVFFMSDGEITTNDKLRSFSKLSKYIDGGAVLGYGTKDGGVMHVRYSATSNSYELLTYYDNWYNDKVAVSCIDEDNLEDLADDMNIEYHHMSKHKNLKSVISDLLDKIESGELVISEEDGSGYAEIYWVFAFALVIMLFVDFIYYRIKLGKER